MINAAPDEGYSRYWTKEEEMAKGNKFQIDRSIFYWEWWDDHEVVIVWLYLIGHANWKPARWHGYEIPRGSFITSIRSLARGCGLSPQQIRTALDKLESTHNITRRATHKFTAITIEKYDDYQLSPSGSNTVSNTLSNKQSTTIEYQIIPDKNKREKDEPSSRSLASEMISYLNERTGQSFKQDGAENVRLISDLVRAGYGANDIRKVIDRKCDEWLDVEHMRYALRPKTLFKRSNFEEYLKAPETAREYEERHKSELKARANEEIESLRAELKILQGDYTLEKDIRKRREIKGRMDWLEDRISNFERSINK